MNRGIIGAAAAAVLVLVFLIWGLRPNTDAGEPVLVGDTGEPVVPGEGIGVRLFFAAGDGLLHLETRTLIYNGPLTTPQDQDGAAGADAEPGGGAALEVEGAAGGTSPDGTSPDGSSSGSASSGVAPADGAPVVVASRASDRRHTAAQLVVRALLQEPETAGLRRVFEEGTQLADVRLTSDGIAIVSLQPAPGSVNRGLGSRAELLRVYSLVNSLAYSVEGVQSVAIIWAGTQPATLAGHVDTSRPLLPSLSWVARDSRESLSSAPEPAS